MSGVEIGAATAAPGGVLRRSRFSVSDLPVWSAAVRTMQAGGREARLLCIGDSVTQGFGGVGGGWTPNGRAVAWPERLAALMSGRGLPASAASVAGAGAADGASGGYQKNAVAYRCIRMIAEAAAAAPFAVFVDGVRDEAHPLAKLIRRPNPEQSGAELMEAVYGALQVSGNAYVEATGDADGDGAPDELWALRSDRVKVIPGRSGWPEAWDYSVDGRSVRIGRAADGWAPVMHLKLWHPLDDWYGLSPMEAAAQGVDAHNAAGAWNKALLDNAARPSGALVYGARNGERLTDGQFEALKDQLSNVYAGATNAGRPILLEGGMDWKPLSLTPAEMDFTAGKHAAAREIALAFGVPPQLLGIPGDATYANYREANAAFWRQTVIPLVRKAAGAMTGWLGERFAGCEVRADLEAVAALQLERDALWARLEAASFLTDEERRRMAGVGA